ncbi:MAG: NADH-quinone oxidoreductase subunit L [Bacteroidales bacterium]
MNFILGLIPLFPLLGFLITGLGFKKLPKKITSIVAPGVILVSFLISVLVLITIITDNQPITNSFFEWIAVGNFKIQFAFMADQLTAIMLLVVTGVGFLIHIYSIGYMYDDPGYNRFFSYMNLFVFSMLLLVLGSNYVIMFIGWEGVGLCSYLLIGFWFNNTNYNNAAKKAFIMNRIGDLGFILGLFLIFQLFGSFEFSEVFGKAAVYDGCPCTVFWICILLFIGAIGKSAQIPLYTWLPDAMAGPTPVSALIHAATMVTAGVYMVARSSILYALAPDSLMVVAVIGIFTALFAATIALYQNDIKKVLAYSTISQLGYMFLGLGVGAFTGAIFHLMTHAFFKALLFLGAGSVIHALQGEQDITKMGGLKKKLPVTFFTFLVGTLAISGIPPFSGFFSKDEILLNAFSQNHILWILGLIGALLTTFYMFRLLYLVFYGKSRGNESQGDHVHEHSKTIKFSLIVLAFLSLFGGVVGIPEAFGGGHLLSKFLLPVFEPAQKIINRNHHVDYQTEYLLIFISVVLIALSIYLAWKKFVIKGIIPSAENFKNKAVSRLMANKYFIDEIYNTTLIKPLLKLSDFVHDIIEKQGIDRLVNTIGNSLLSFGNTARRIQTGTTGFYLLAMVICIITMLIVNLLIV